MLNRSTLRAGLFVSLKTSLRGNVSYRSEDIERDHVTDTGERRASWNTERTIANPEEFESAKEAQSKASSLIRSACVASGVWLMCPQEKASNLESAVSEAESIVAAFNTSARMTRLDLYVVSFEIEQDEARFVKAINREIRDLMEDMETGLKNLDVEQIRRAANQAKQIGGMLMPEAAERLQGAIDAARQVARRITKAGEQAAAEVDNATIRRIAEARTAFLDLDETAPVAAPVAQEGRTLDLAPEGEPAPLSAPAYNPVPSFDF